MKVRRTQYELYWEILTFCKSPRSFTSIIHHCNLNSKIGKEYLNFLIKKQYLMKTEKNQIHHYIITDKAQEYLTLFSKLYNELFEKNPRS